MMMMNILDDSEFLLLSKDDHVSIFSHTFRENVHFPNSSHEMKEKMMEAKEFLFL